MSYPKNKEDWWTLVDENWEALLSILARFLPLSTKPPGTPSDILKAKKNKDGYKLLRYFNSAWNEAPDESWIHEIPAWDVLCTLCSEDYVLEEDNG